jgi:putative acetyltransferase
LARAASDYVPLSPPGPRHPASPGRLSSNVRRHNSHPRMLLREATPTDRPEVLQAHRLAFGREDESQLVDNLLADPSAQPVLSLLAEDDGRVVGHVLFTSVTLLGPKNPPSASILAPLAVIPAAQRIGVGRSLIERGCQLLAVRGVQLLFVLGDPSYYTKRGFVPALPHGLRAPYDIEPEAAWMVRDLASRVPATLQAQVSCADALAPEQYWRE